MLPSTAIGYKCNNDPLDRCYVYVSLGSCTTAGIVWFAVKFTHLARVMITSPPLIE